MKEIKNILPINKFTRPGTKLKSVKGIVMHYTASPGASAENIGNYFLRLSKQSADDNEADRFASAHYSVDEKTVVQSVPEEEMAYHVGSKTYAAEAIKRLGNYPNNCTIGIEMCINREGKITEDTFMQAAKLTARLLRKYKLTTEDIWTHKGVVGWKDCPLPWIQKPEELKRFKDTVKKLLS